MSDQVVLILLIALTSLVVIVALAVEEPDATPRSHDLDPISEDAVVAVATGDELDCGQRLNEDGEDHDDARRPADLPETARP